MNKPNNYDNTKASGDFTPVELGGHHLIIKQVTETQSKSGRNMLVVLFDMAKNDKQPEYMNEEFKNDIRPEKKWPHAGTSYILTEDEMAIAHESLKLLSPALRNPTIAKLHGASHLLSSLRTRRSAAYMVKSKTNTMARLPCVMS